MRFPLPNRMLEIVFWMLAAGQWRWRASEKCGNSPHDAGRAVRWPPSQGREIGGVCRTVHKPV